MTGLATLTSFFASNQIRKRKLNDRKDSRQVLKETQNNKKSKQQMFLDLGQKNFSKRETCSKCGMIYDSSVDEDRKEHSKACRDFVEGVPFQPRQGKVVGTYGNDTIVEIRPNDGTALKKKLHQVQSIVNRELSFAESSDSAPKHAYFYTRNKRVIGMVVTERIQAGYLLHDNHERSTQKIPASIGIYQVWVHSRYRGEKIATKLVDAARESMVFGYVVPRDKVAFSSPTEAGISFARKYTGEVLVYDFV